MIGKNNVVQITVVMASICAQCADWKPLLTATSSVHFVTTTSNAVAGVVAYIPENAAQVTGVYRSCPGVDSFDRLYLFSDGTYVRAAHNSFLALRIEDEGCWGVSNGVVLLDQRINRCTNSWATVDNSLIPVKREGATYLIGAHWVYSYMVEKNSRDAEWRFVLYGYVLEKGLDSESSSVTKTGLLERWKREEPRREDEDRSRGN